VPSNEPKCDHICLKDDGHVERGEGHFYGYELPSPRQAGGMTYQELAEFIAIAISEEPNGMGLTWTQTEAIAAVVATKMGRR
jgi:hypothetical protein